ncbi:hypothetical protein BKL67_08020 [Staphylococcus epidermidis]|nr:hypothetical protein BKL67_08020 [Staphylococcus epidermidis]
MKARNLLKLENEKIFQKNNYMRFSFNIIMDENVKQIVSYNFNDQNELTITMNKRFLKEYTDLRMVLNNIIDLIGIVNGNGIFNFVINYDDNNFLNKLQKFTKESYKVYFEQEYMINIYKSLFMIYYDLLNFKGIELTNIYAAYFNEYVPEEFNINSFFIEEIPTHIDFHDKIIILLTRFESLIKQFYLIRKEHEIFDEQFEALGDQVSYDNLTSFIQDKYFYLSNDTIAKICENLFSNSTIFSFYSKKEKTYKCLAEKIFEGLEYNELNNVQKKYIDFLESEKIVLIENNKKIEFENERYIILIFKIWKYGYLNSIYLNDDELNILYEGVKKKYFKTSNLLFSKSELDYLKYILDNKNFDNSLGLRNKYIHGKFSRISEKENDSDIHKFNYIEILIVVFLFIVKVNEELEFASLTGIELK